jgi:hypothetical protein
MNQRLVTAMQLKTKVACTPTSCNAVSSRLRESAKQETALIERLTDDENK